MDDLRDLANDLAGEYVDILQIEPSLNKVNLYGGSIEQRLAVSGMIEDCIVRKDRHDRLTRPLFCFSDSKSEEQGVYNMDLGAMLLVWERQKKCKEK